MLDGRKRENTVFSVFPHSKRTRLVTRLVTRVGSCNGLQGSYKLVMMAFKACNPMELVMMTRLVMIFK